MRGTVLLWSGVPDEAVAALETSLALAEGPDAPDALVAVPQLSLWLAYLARGQFDRSRGSAERGAAVAKKTGDTDLLAVHTANLGLQHFYEGDWREARDCLERAVDLARGTQLSYYSYLPSAYLGVLRKAEGAWDEAIRCFSDAAALAGKAGNREGSRYAEVRLLELDVLRGHPAEAIARLGPEVPDLTWWNEVLLLTVLAEAYADSGDAVKAEEVAAGAVGRARATRNRVDGVEALRVPGRRASRCGDAQKRRARRWRRPCPGHAPCPTLTPGPASSTSTGCSTSTKESPEGRGSGSPRPWAFPQAGSEEGSRAHRTGASGTRPGVATARRPSATSTSMRRSGISRSGHPHRAVENGLAPLLANSPVLE